MISVVIPYYNHQDAIEATLRSIAAQAGVVTEVIIIDDGSDIPLDIHIAQSIIPHVRLIRHDTNKGAPSARNKGLSESKGSMIIFWDADVVAAPTMLETMKHILDTHTDIDFVYSNFIFGPKRFAGQQFSLKTLRERNYIHSTTLVRRSAAMPWDESLKKLQDWDYWLTLSETRHRGHWIDEVLFTVGQRKEGISRWIPSFAYKKPFRYLPMFQTHVLAYERAEYVVKKKHGLI